MMRVLEEVIQKCKLELVVTSAVRSWTLLLSIAPDHSLPVLFTRWATLYTVISLGDIFTGRFVCVFTGL